MKNKAFIISDFFQTSLSQTYVKVLFQKSQYYESCYSPILLSSVANALCQLGFTIIHVHIVKTQVIL